MTQAWKRSIGILLLAGAVAPAARADENKALAHQHYEKAKKYSEEGDHRAAIIELQEAYAAGHKPNMLYNLGREYALAGEMKNVTDLARAAEYYEQYLKARPDAPDNREVGDAIEKIKAAIQKEAEEAKRKVEEEAAAKERVEEEKHAAEKREVEARKREAATKRLAAPVVAPVDPAPARTSNNRLILGGTLIGVSAALGVGAGVLFGVAPGINDGAPGQPTVGDAYNRHDLAGQLRLVGGVLAGVGAAAIVAGIVFLVPRRQKETRTALWLAPAAGTLVLRGTF